MPLLSRSALSLAAAAVGLAALSFSDTEDIERELRSSGRIVALGGCQPTAGAPASAGAPTSTGTSFPAPASASLSSAPAPRCALEEARCLSESEAEACSEDGLSAVRERCDDASICIAGRCTSLRAPAALSTKGDVVLRRDALFAVSGEGWLNGWSIAGPLYGAQAEPFLNDPGAAFAPASLSFRAACSPSGYVLVHERAKQKLEGPESMLLAGYLVAPRAQKVEIRAGFGGSMRLLLNGRPVFADVVARPASTRPFKDEVLGDAELRAGVNSIVIVIERSGEAASGLWLRLRDAAGLPISGLHFAPASVGCALSDLTLVNFTPTPVKGGFSIDVHMKLLGLSPRELPEAPYRAELRKENKTETPAEELAKGSIELADLSRGSSRVPLSVKPKGPGAYEIALTAGRADEVKARARLLYRGELHDRIVELARRVEALPPDRAPQGSLDSVTHHVRGLIQSLAESHPDEGWIAARAKDAEGIVRALEDGRDPYREKTGVVRRAYRSELDGELQPYVIVVPPSYKPDRKPMPLIVTFHGLESQPEHALRAVIGEAPDKDTDSGWAARHLPAFPDNGVLLAAPWGYGKAGQRPLGEHDVLRVIEEMRAYYRIDERRISITGASLGGTVAFALPLHYPDIFSASAPLCGYPNLLAWQSVRSVPHAPWEDTLLVKRYIGNYAENGLYVPLHIVHGGLDVPERSKVIADRYRQLGYSHTFDVQDDLDHNVWDYAYEDGRMITWLKARRRPEAPARARLVTGEYRYAKAYWVRLIAMHDDTKLAEIDARWTASASRTGAGEARVTTRNVEAFALDLTAFKVPADAKAVIDGRFIAIPEGAGVLFFEWDGSGFTRVAEAPSRANKKRPGVAGPLDDILRHPQLIVYGTQDPTQTEANRMVAEHASSYDHWAYAHFPIKADTDVTPSDLAARSLVLIGGPASNKVTASLIEALPVRFEPGALVVRGKRFEGRDVGVSLIYPHPTAFGEYVVLHAGVTARGTLASRHLPQLAPDYLIYDSRITVDRGDTLLGKRAVLDGGFFDQNWK